MVSAIQKKIFRDIKENSVAFVAIICICSLGIALFSGINLYVHTVQSEVDDYYNRANLADYWVYKAEFSNADIENIRNMDIIAQSELRKITDISLSGSYDSVLRLHTLGEMTFINAVELLSGETLDEKDSKALLLDSRFAEAYGLKAGDYLEGWLIKGIVRSVEYIYYAPEGLTIPDYHKYGFAYTNASSLPDVPFNEMVLTIKDTSMSPDKIMNELREFLGGANILSREHQPSCRKMTDSLTGVRQIGVLFSIAFLLTAALVTWITVSRMMENQRQHLGTLRSLGFSRKEITRRYVIFGIVITIPSVIIGWIIARFVIAGSLYDVGITYFTIEKTGVDLFSVHFLLAVLCAALVTVVCLSFSCRSALRFSPAALMRPKPPAEGHRILLERFPFFWRRLSFSGKIVTRNLFRNKARLCMGLIGIIGSTSLIICGFGLMNSISAAQSKAFDETVRFDAEIKLRTALPEKELAEIYEMLDGAKNIDATMAYSVYIHGENGSAQSPYLVIMDDTQTSLNFADVNGKAVLLPERGALITPRMSDALDIGVGDLITTQGIDGAILSFEISGIVDFPVGNEIYMSKTAFSNISDMPFLVRTLLISADGLDLEPLKNDSRVALVETREEMRDNMRIVLEVLQGFQFILIAFSGLLAFAVMMVLGRMNYYERIRELATLKVLGFYKNEIKRLVLRENIWITVFGLPMGYIIGSMLLVVITKSATTPDLELAPYINIFSVVIGFAIMMTFTVFVNYIIGKKFKGINMVASLKSVE